MHCLWVHSVSCGDQRTVRLHSGRIQPFRPRCCHPSSWINLFSRQYSRRRQGPRGQPYATWHVTDQLFVCFGPGKEGAPLSKQRLSHWVADSIVEAYRAAGYVLSATVKCDSTWAVVYAALQGVPLSEICAAATWASPCTFTRFYWLNLAKYRQLFHFGVNYPFKNINMHMYEHCKLHWNFSWEVLLCV